MISELANKYSWQQVRSVPVSLTIYQKSKVCPALMYMQHRKMVCGKLNICHDLILYQNVNDKAFPTPFIYEHLDVNQKMLMLAIVWYHNTFLHICVQHQHYPEHDTLCMYIFFYCLFYCLYPDKRLHVYDHP